MAGHTYTVEFRIFSEKLDPASVTRELHLKPCQVRTRGGSRFPGRVDREGMWAYDGADGRHVKWESLEDGLAYVLDSLWPHREAIARYQTSASLVWWCGHFQSSFDGGPTLSPGLLKRLGEFGAELYIDNYLSDPDGPSEPSRDAKRMFRSPAQDRGPTSGSGMGP